MIVKAHYEWDRVKGEQKTARQQAEKGFTFAVPQGDTERAMLRERIIEELSSEIPAELSNVPSAEQVAASILKHTGKRKAILKASGEMEVLEEIKEHVEAIATALVDDMTKDIMDAVGRDPRIQKRCIKPRRQLEKEIIRQYQREMSEKRKEKLALFNFATLTTLSGLSTKAFEAVRKAMQKMGGRGVLPSVTALRAARAELEKISIEDMGVYGTPDGWFVSARAVVENEILRIMQVVDDGKGTRQEAGGRVMGIGPGGHGWQDRFHVKIQLDARRITRRISQTEVMLLIIPKGQDGVDRCQKAVYQRTVGIWTGKDSRENVQANMKTFFQEIESLQAEGVVYSQEADTLLGIHQQTVKEGPVDGSQEWATRLQQGRGLSRVRLDFWLGADMAAQCAVLGHGCAGNEYCGHCAAHKSQRHIPYKLMRVEEAISFQRLAQEHDMFPSSLYAINAGNETQGGETEHGLRSCTADATFEEETWEEVDSEDGEAEAQPDPDSEEVAQMRPAGRKAGRRAQLRKVLSTCKGPHVAALAHLTGWRQNHDLDCPCTKCRVPGGTVVRVIPRHSGDWRKSDWLSEVWPSHNRNRFPFCALHCLMRITEAMFMMVTQRCLKNEPVINRLNAGLEAAGICKQLSKIPGATGVHTYEKLTFEGHQALKLLAIDESDGGKMAVNRILESMWPKGDADGENGRAYVPRAAELWRQWAKVVEIMTERDPAQVEAVDGFNRFGKECREFCRLYQAMYHEQHCRSFYLHLLMHHAGDFMRELQNEGMCIGMMSNSGVERRHEYGRRAAKKALAGGCWRQKVPELADKENLFAYLTLKEILIWQYGTDLVSRQYAERAASGRGGQGSRSNQAANGSDTDDWSCDADRRALDNAELSDEPASCADTCELDGVAYEGELAEGSPLPPGVREEADGKRAYFAERDPRLFKGRDDLCGVLEQESVAGSDEFEDEDAEAMARRVKDLEDLRGDWLAEEDSEDGDYQGRSDDEESHQGPEDMTWETFGPQRMPGPPIALSRERRGRKRPPQPAGRRARAATRPSQSSKADPPAPAGTNAGPARGRPRQNPKAQAAAQAAASDSPGGVQPPWAWNDLAKMNASELKNLCRNHGLAVGGKKDTLMSRLVNVVAAAAAGPAQEPAVAADRAEAAPAVVAAAAASTAAAAENVAPPALAGRRSWRREAGGPS